MDEVIYWPHHAWPALERRLHRAIEAKEGVRIEHEHQRLAFCFDLAELWFAFWQPQCQTAHDPVI